MIGERPEWHARAACHGLTALFFPAQGEDTSQAKAICDRCPVRRQCGVAGRNEAYGLWGGESTRVRNRTRRTNLRVAS